MISMPTSRVRGSSRDDKPDSSRSSSQSHHVSAGRRCPFPSILQFALALIAAASSVATLDAVSAVAMTLIVLPLILTLKVSPVSTFSGISVVT